MNNASSEEPFLLRSKKRAIPLLSMALAGPTPATIPLYPSRLWIPYTNSLQSFSKEVLSVGFMELSKLLSKLPPIAGDSNSEQHSPATAVSDFGSVATPLNVLNLHLALRNHPNMDFVKINNACNFGRELRSATPALNFSSVFEEFTYCQEFLNSEVVTSNVVEEVAKGHTAGHSSPPFENLQVSPIGLDLRLVHVHNLLCSCFVFGTKLQSQEIWKRTIPFI